ncbi:hypothetical protein ElyMa_000716400 [Elysia marginata]|uniref:Uncharacterized protein n=1 Tax=Elysia marginata TaxID=1093978 RepID=A0AAV4GMM0_9GAST|nr:hypothetical protein ElyMa_000716400 [Elysia marginata]
MRFGLGDILAENLPSYQVNTWQLAVSSLAYRISPEQDDGLDPAGCPRRDERGTATEVARLQASARLMRSRQYRQIASSLH